MTKYGYARVSTNGQDLSDQIEQLKREGISSDNIFQEKFTGTTSKRPQFIKLQHKLKGGDEIVVTKLDRLGRRTSEVISLLDEWGKENITVNILNMGRLDNTPTGKLMRNVISSFAEFERDLIVNRTSEGKRYAKKHNANYHEGRPKRKILGRNKDIYEYSFNHSIKETARAMGISESTVKRIKRQAREEHILNTKF